MDGRFYHGAADEARQDERLSKNRRGFLPSDLAAQIEIARREGNNEIDFRSRICKFEDNLFDKFPLGREIVLWSEAKKLIASVFEQAYREAPRLKLVKGFTNPKIGGWANFADYKIVIENGYLHRFLILHESAHMFVPEDRKHGPAFTFVLQGLYRAFLGVSATTMRDCLTAHRLPSFGTELTPLWSSANRETLARKPAAEEKPVRVVSSLFRRAANWRSQSL